MRLEFSPSPLPTVQTFLSPCLGYPQPADKKTVTILFLIFVKLGHRSRVLYTIPRSVSKSTSFLHNSFVFCVASLFHFYTRRDSALSSLKASTHAVLSSFSELCRCCSSINERTISSPHLSLVIAQVFDSLSSQQAPLVLSPHCVASITQCHCCGPARPLLLGKLLSSSRSL